jgi:hypothetical protein
MVRFCRFLLRTNESCVRCNAIERIVVTLHPSPERTPPFRINSLSFHYSNQHLLKDVEIKNQHRLCLVKIVNKHLMRETQIDVHKHVLVPLTFTQEHHIQQNSSNIEDMDHGD